MSIFSRKLGRNPFKSSGSADAGASRVVVDVADAGDKKPPTAPTKEVAKTVKVADKVATEKKKEDPVVAKSVPPATVDSPTMETQPPKDAKVGGASAKSEQEAARKILAEGDKAGPFH